MDFMSIGSSEILMIILVAVLVVGPNRIVEIARTIGRITRTIKKTTAELTTSVTREIELEEKEKQSSLDSEKKGQPPEDETSKK